MTITKQNAIAQVENSISSIFSKEDVLFLLNNIEVGSSRKITTFDIGRAIDQTHVMGMVGGAAHSATVWTVRKYDAEVGSISDIVDH